MLQYLVLQLQAHKNRPKVVVKQFFIHGAKQIHAMAWMENELEIAFFRFRFQRFPTERPYFIAKEILMTERTYKKDLEVINLVSKQLWK